MSDLFHSIEFPPTLVAGRGGIRGRAVERKLQREEEGARERRCKLTIQFCPYPIFKHDRAILFLQKIVTLNENSKKNQRACVVVPCICALPISIFPNKNWETGGRIFCFLVSHSSRENSDKCEKKSKRANWREESSPWKRCNSYCLNTRNVVRQRDSWVVVVSRNGQSKQVQNRRTGVETKKAIWHRGSERNKGGWFMFVFLQSSLDSRRNM